jgi:hypothetical protein
MRLIDADALADALFEKRKNYPQWVADTIGNMPEAVVRCKDCKHRPIQTEPPKTYGFSIEFPEGSKCPCQCDDGFYSWYPADNWFCADGEPKDS